jgi:hypothetical protein
MNYPKAGISAIMIEVSFFVNKCDMNFPIVVITFKTDFYTCELFYIFKDTIFLSASLAIILASSNCDTRFSDIKRIE